ncbi:ABC transporter G family member 9-like protein [Tanacetum coccineum]
MEQELVNQTNPGKKRFKTNRLITPMMEILVFTALLRLHKSLIKQQKVEQAEAVINQLRLTKCMTSIIGEGKRRVSIGQEMLINPSLLFLDEPTSGLDSTTAQRIVLTLWELTRGEGNPLFFGNGSEIMYYFQSIGFSPSVAMNPANFLLDHANGISSDESSQNAETESGLLFFYIDFSGFFPLFQAIFTFPQEQEMLAKERSSGMYKLSSYFMSRTIRDQTLDNDLLDGWAQTRCWKFFIRIVHNSLKRIGLTRTRTCSWCTRHGPQISRCSRICDHVILHVSRWILRSKCPTFHIVDQICLIRTSSCWDLNMRRTKPITVAVWLLGYRMQGRNQGGYRGCPGTPWIFSM